MSTKLYAIVLVLLLSSTLVSQADTYELDWKDLHQPLIQSTDSYTLNWENVDQYSPSSADSEEPGAEEAGEVVALFTSKYSPRTRASASQQRSQQPAQAPRNINLTFSGRQVYDYYAERFNVVDRIEVAVFRKSGGTFYQTYFNTGQLQSYDIYVNGLAMGDRYRAVVIWEDGSNRTFEQTLSSYSYTTLVADQPDHLAYSQWVIR